RVETGQRGVLGPAVAPTHGLLQGLLALAGRPDRAGDGVALAQPVPLDQLQRHVDVAAAGQVAGGAHERVVVEDVGDGHQHVVLGDLGLRLLDLTLAGGTRGTALVAVATTVASTAATPAV